MWSLFGAASKGPTPCRWPGFCGQKVLHGHTLRHKCKHLVCNLDPVSWNPLWDLPTKEATNLETNHAAKITQPVSFKLAYQRYQQMNSKDNDRHPLPRFRCFTLIQHDRASRNLKKSERAARARFNQKNVQDFDAISSVQNTLRHFKTIFFVWSERLNKNNVQHQFTASNKSQYS